ncbi:hypothetical protein ACI49J_02340 [Metallosphaera sp. D4-4]|uniref:hypothetical protein n=1 Tax=Metallosphaera sp. D4-4 TaxID=3379815 RepID=UPI003908A787
MNRVLVPAVIAVVVVVAVVAFLLLHPGTPPLPLNETVINSTLGPGKILPTSGSYQVKDGYVIVHQLNGETTNQSFSVLVNGVYQPSEVKSGVLEYVNGSSYHATVIVFQLVNVVSSNYTQIINGSGTTIILVHRGYAEADLYYFGGHLTSSQDQALISVLSRYLESL